MTPPPPRTSLSLYVSSRTMARLSSLIMSNISAKLVDSRDKDSPSCRSQFSRECDRERPDLRNTLFATLSTAAANDHLLVTRTSLRPHSQRKIVFFLLRQVALYFPDKHLPPLLGVLNRSP
ncbi:unnamed protein product, partial [Ectocarpus sp. 12 AP-2014]